MIIYATRPLSALVGACVVSGHRNGTPKKLWEEIGQRSGCTYEEFFAYFSGAKHGVALEIDSVHEIETIGIEALLRRFNWRPPVSWCRVQPKSPLGLFLDAAK